jgi:hypothetical protein
MPPLNIKRPGQRITEPTEGLIRRARRNRKQPMVFDQRMQCYRLPASAFEPRLPQNRPNAGRFDKFLSVNIESSLRNEGAALDWGCDHRSFYAGKLAVEAVEAKLLTVSWEPVSPDASDLIGNPHHGAINGVVELYYRNLLEYELVIAHLSRASSVLPECLAAAGSGQI